MTFLLPVIFTRLASDFFVLRPWDILASNFFVIFINHDDPTVRGAGRRALGGKWRLGKGEKLFELLLADMSHAFFSASQGELDFDGVAFTKEFVNLVGFEL